MAALERPHSSDSAVPALVVREEVVEVVEEVEVPGREEEEQLCLLASLEPVEVEPCGSEWTGRTEPLAEGLGRGSGLAWREPLRGFQLGEEEAELRRSLRWS